MKTPLLTTAYFAPVQYYSKFIDSSNVSVEIFDTYMKQTYRNRCVIYTANGAMPLSVPIVKISGKVLTKDVKIGYSEDWRKNHFKAIESAYRSSPYYEYYIHDIEPIFLKKHNFLIDLNNEIHNVLSSILELDVVYNYTEDFVQPNSLDCLDYRELISPKSKIIDADFKQKEYHQVFTEKHGFIPNLSVLDLIFNEGPNSYSCL